MPLGTTGTPHPGRCPGNAEHASRASAPGSVQKGHPGWRLDFWALVSAPRTCAEDRSLRGGNITFPSLCSGRQVLSLLGGWGRHPAIFLHNLPLGVGDGCGRLLGVAKPIFHMQSKVILICVSSFLVNNFKLTGSSASLERPDPPFVFSSRDRRSHFETCARASLILSQPL